MRESERQKETLSVVGRKVLYSQDEPVSPLTDAEKSSERERTVMSYEQAFEKIKEATGITDIDKLVNKFIEGNRNLISGAETITALFSNLCLQLSHAVEDQNFALFNYVNELNGDIELIMEQIQQVRNVCVHACVHSMRVCLFIAMLEKL